MTAIIAGPCVNVKDGACLDVPPVDCIHPTNSKPDYEQHNQLYINPNACIDCGACEPACPVATIFEESVAPKQWRQSIKINADRLRIGYWSSQYEQSEQDHAEAFSRIC